MKKKREVLFVCKYNRFRSKIAEAYFKQINKNRLMKARSSGIIEMNNPLSFGEKERNRYLKKKHGIRFKIKSQGVSAKLLEKADKIIIVAGDVAKDIFNHHQWRNKVEVWKVKDESSANKKNIDLIVNQIKKKVKELVKSE